MTNYVVKWQINIEADTREEAAKLAWKWLHTPDTEASLLDVHEAGTLISVGELKHEKNKQDLGYLHDSGNAPYKS